MKKKNLLLPFTTLALLLGVGLAACSGSSEPEKSNASGGPVSQESSQKLETIKITAEGGKTSMYLGGTLQLNADQSDVTWASKNEAIATVNSSGLVTAVAQGTVQITASKEGFNTAQISIRVDLEPITITAAENKNSIEIDQTLQLSANKDGVSWASSDATIASVSDKGLVTALKAGTVSITAAKDKFKTGSYSITVTRTAPLITMHWEEADHYSEDGWWGTAEDGYTPVYARSDGNASDLQCIAHLVKGDKETMSFTSDKAIKAELVVTMASSSGIEDLSTVMVAKFNDQELSLAGVGATSGSNSQFDDVSLGEVDIIAGKNVLELSFTGSGPYIDDLRVHSKQSATITFNASPAKERIEAKEAAVTAYIGEETQLEFTKPTSLEGMTFVSDKEGVAAVGADGKVTGVALGTANITAMKDGMLATRIEVVVEKRILQGEIRVEAEDQPDDFDWSSIGFHKYTDRTSGITNGHSGSAYITGYDVSSETTLTYTFKSTKDQTMKFIIAGAPHYRMEEADFFSFKDDCRMKINGVEITVNEEAVIHGPGGMGAATVEVEIGNVDIKSGDNTFELTLIEKGIALDCFRFMPLA